MQISRWVKTTKILLICLLLAGLLIGCQVLPDSGDIDQTETEVPQLPQPKTLTDPREIELNSVIQKAAAGREDVLAFIIFRITIDHVEFSSDETLALVYFSLVDKDTGQVQNSEPGMVIAHATGDSTDPWRVVFQAEPAFAQDLMAVPETMISQEAKEH